MQLLGLSLLTLARTLERDAEFRMHWNRLQELLGLNVSTLLYRAAITGDAAAQKSYMQLKPAQRRAADDHPPSQSPDEMADDDFLAQFQRDAPLLLAQLAAQGVAAPGDNQSGLVP